MLFSSIIFLFYFLPALLLFYYLAPNVNIKNRILLLFSFIFFLWGGSFFTLILLFSISFNYLSALNIQKFHSKASLALAVGGNLLVLVIFKYTNFLVDSLNSVLSIIHIAEIPPPGIILPIGISFYTFHAISYNIDVYYRRSSAQSNILDMALYIILFSQLVAGPIIRYNTFSPQLFNRTHSFEKFYNGVERFIIGLGKKVLIANTVGRIADGAFSQDQAHMDTLLLWMGILCYTLQIYFDFGGYSDMAIGLSRMFGFEFPENFNLPYIATSIKDFWTRWHISLSSFFKDYLYIPLGGNRKGEARTLLNLLIVFFLTGLWHGASFTFIAWGMVHGGFLLLERTRFGVLLNKLPTFIRWLYAFFVVMMAWVPFRTSTIELAYNYWKNLFWVNEIKTQLTLSYFTTDVILALIAALLLALNVQGILVRKLSLLRSPSVIEFSKVAFLFFVFVISTIYLMSGTYNPFIYYQF